ncbi:ribosomal protein S18-alanine N-acetyltransferase [Halomonas sp. SH5A2]|uniref:ribosomal protein S18-alanine N-acetyltransferase n=1 Tax=Halomonas sp. SH5A2 TaxID=2749040 RepID=UPI00163FB10D|nr:ribosomal protein S18-alanine N-acetyltransferase [Halomonas sp. SH5A2]QNI01864.1 ribosomal protein S18-alanine N-acetyltransferase [Halomonas sp. SH5A2]
MITELRDNDVSALEALEACALSGVSTALLREALEADTACVMGNWQENQLIGYALLARLPYDAELQAIGVRPEQRGQGVGDRLLKAVLAVAARWQSERVLLEVRESNAAAIRLYQGAGFQQDGFRRNYYPAADGGAGQESALLMSRSV